MRWLAASLFLTIGALVTSGCPPEDGKPDSGAGGAAPNGTCGIAQLCDTDQECADFCSVLCEGPENTDMAFCLSGDGRCVCACVTGKCDREPCLPGGACSDDQDCEDAQEDAGKDNCLAVCDGEEDLRSASCRPTGSCECICNASGMTSCLD